MNFETSFAPLDSAKKHSSLSMVKEIGKQLLVMGNSLNLLLHIAVNRSIGTSRQQTHSFLHNKVRTIHKAKVALASPSPGNNVQAVVLTKVDVYQTFSHHFWKDGNLRQGKPL